MIVVIILISIATLSAFIVCIGAILDKDHKKAVKTLILTIVLTVFSWWVWEVTNEHHDRSRYHIYEERLQILRDQEENGHKELQARIIDLEEEQAVVLSNMKNRRRFFPGRIFYKTEPKVILGIE